MDILMKVKIITVRIVLCSNTFKWPLSRIKGRQKESKTPNKIVASIIESNL